MSVKKLQCREHGGYFTVEARRGRPPVRCTEDNQCDAQRVPSTSARTVKPRSDATKTGLAAIRSKTATSDATAASSNASARPPRGANWVADRAATTREINRIFREVTIQGWNAKRGWMDNNAAEITATRGEEMLYIVVRNGECIAQKYSLWSFDKPSLNGKPKANLPFDPDEIGDRELAQFIVGNKVTWYNRLAGKEETAICGRDNVRIEHGYNAVGDEMPGERIVKFVDATGHGFGAFRLDQLLKVGK